MKSVRKAGPEDAQALLPLVADYWAFESIAGFDAKRLLPQIERLLAEPGLGAGWIALDDDTPVGYLLGVFVFSLEHMGLTAEIDEFFVHPAARGTGTGAELLRAAEAEFARLGCTNVSLQLSRDNEAGRRFYRGFGYRERPGFELLDKMLSP